MDEEETIHLLDAVEPDGQLDDVETNSKFEDLAKLAGAQFTALTPLLAGSPLRSMEATLPVIEEMEKLTVTRKSLKVLSSTVATVREYKDHEDVQVRLRASTLLQAWRTIFRQGGKCDVHCAQDIIRPRTLKRRLSRKASTEA